MNHHILIALSTLMACTVGAQYQGPESVEYDPVGDRYFVSNTSSSMIKVRTQSGTVTDFVAVSPAPYGLEIKGDTLFACSGGSVKGYLLSDGSQVFNLSLGGTFLNGITTDGHYLYATDFNQQRIFRVEPTANAFTTWVASTGGTPNGIVFDPVSDQLLVAFWNSNAIVRGYDRGSAAIMGNVSTGLTNIDGITLDCNGQVLISSWSPDRITRFEWGILSPTFEDLMVPGLNNPADIDYDAVNDKVCIPNSGNNTVTLFTLGCISTGVMDGEPGRTVIFPNPAEDLLHVRGLTAGSYAWSIVGSDGRVLEEGVGLTEAGAVDVSTLNSGFYVLVLSGPGDDLLRTPFKKQ